MAKAKKATTEKKESYYIGVPNHTGIRRNVLECSKDIIGIIKQSYKVKEIRKRKLELTTQLHATMKEIKSSIAALKKMLPKVVPPSAPKKVVPQAAPVPKTQKAQPQVAKKQMTELEKLESDLQQIESKLSEL